MTQEWLPVYGLALFGIVMALDHYGVVDVMQSPLAMITLGVAIGLISRIRIEKKEVKE